MKGFLLPTLMFFAIVCHAQEKLSVKDGPPQTDEAFTSGLIAALSDAGNNFANLKKTFVMRDIVDSTWSLNQMLPGADEATIKKSKETIILSEHFKFGSNKAGRNKLLEKIKSALPADFVYTAAYDVFAKSHEYIFTVKEGSTQKHPGFPKTFSLIGDDAAGTLSIMIRR